VDCEVKVFKLLDGGNIMQPFACTLHGAIHHLNDEEAYCKTCKAVVEFETHLNALGLYNHCPVCGNRNLVYG
jgi:Zn finger protein HypA/HybF involved in hydrogenase expression